MDKAKISQWFRELQDQICSGLEELDGLGTFHQDIWERPEGGGGRSRVIKGAIIEKGGVNYSAVHGDMPEQIAKSLGLGPNQFYATGVSIVLHPKNPHVPIIHMNVRYFETDTGTHWFGGGIDLTPHYIYESDAVFFHQSLKTACDHLDEEAYPRYKKWADDYFYIRHRSETRGIGGIFFDRLTADTDEQKAHNFSFVQKVGESFLPIYFKMVLNNNHKPFGETELLWQRLRRGRYVEFNLVWDRGTKFGLQTNGRIESILMSMPPQANWIYDFKTTDGSPEEKTQNLLIKDFDWINHKVT